MSIIATIFAFFLFFFMLLFSISGRYNENEKNSYECGFVPSSPLQVSFSIHFFIILIIFIIFDLEIVLLVSLLMGHSGFFLPFFLLMLFVVGGVYLELTLSTLQWSV